MDRIRELKFEKAKEMKNENRIIRENILILKGKTIEHNQQLNRLINHEKILGRSSIERTKEEKKHYFKELRIQEMEKERNGVELKESELVFWKNQYEQILKNNAQL